MKSSPEVIKRIAEIDSQIGELQARYDLQLELPVNQRDKRLMSFILNEIQIFELVKSHLNWVVEN